MTKEYKSTDTELIFSYPKALNKKDPMKHWTEVYYPEELKKNMDPEEKKLRNSLYCYNRTHTPVTLEEYRLIHKPHHKKPKPQHKYILQNSKETLKFHRYKEIMDFLNITYWQVVYMMNSGKVYKGYTLDRLEV